MLLARLASRLVKAGTLTLIDHKGRSQVFRGAQSGPACTLRFHDAAIARQLFFNPLLAFGEAYMDGRLTIEDGDIYDALAFMAESMGWDEPDHWVARLPGRGRLERDSPADADSHRPRPPAAGNRAPAPRPRPASPYPRKPPPPLANSASSPLLSSNRPQDNSPRPRQTSQTP